VGLRVTTGAKSGPARGRNNPKYAEKPGGTFILLCRYFASSDEVTQEDVMGRGLLLWLIGIPLPIILLIWLFGGLHG
jgi:hypothetical protein